ncbi:MAG: metallophosphoesterase [bacterium]
MKIAVISDSHDHLENLRRVLARVRREGAEAVIHCGDYCAPFVLHELETLAVPVHGVFGNVDGDRHLMTRIALTELEHVELHGEMAELELGGWRIGANHYPQLAEGLAASGRFDLVAYGHTHEADKRKVGECWLLNPGEIMGRKGSVGFAMVDTEEGRVGHVTL